MTERDDLEGLEYGGEAPTVEVTVYRHGELVHRELCESAESAADVVARWGELDGVECFVDDLATRHHEGEILEPEAEETYPEDEYPEPAGPEEES